MAISDVFIRTTKEVVESSIEGFLFDITVALLILLLGFIVGKLAGRILSKVLHQLKVNELLRKIGVQNPVEGVAGSIMSLAIYVGSVLAALNQLRIAPLVLYIIIITVIAVCAISFLLSVKDFMPNLFAGLFVYRHGLIREGDVVQIQDTIGKVVHLNLLETQLETKEGDIIFIPNTLLTKNKVIKLHSEKKR